MTNIKPIALVLSLFFVLISCGSREDIVYFQNVDQVVASRSIKNYNAIIKPDDQLTINVSALDMDLVRPFNLVNGSFIDASGDINRVQQTYLVDSNGNIDFPALGKLKLAGLSRIQATEMLRTQLKDYVKDPIVNIRIINFQVTVLGEVRNPGSFIIQNERITVLEALGLAGDLTINAKRDNVLLIREENGKKTYNRIDLTSEDVFNSPVYYLTQNDVIYIEPNKSKVKSSNIGPNTSTTLSIVGTLITAAALVVSITNN